MSISESQRTSTTATPLPAPHATTHAPRARSSRIVLVLLGLALLAAALWFVRAKKSAAPPSAPSADARVVPVVVATVKQADVPITLEGLGNAVPLQTVTVRSQVDGRLDSVAFKEGQAVKKGDVLAQVDPRPFTIQLHTAEAARARDEAQLRNGKLNLDRYETLRKQNLIPQQQVDDQQTTVDQYAATVKADEAQIENARLQLDYARIVSPIDGVTGVRLVDPGNLVHANDPSGIVVITQLDPMAVVFTLPQDDLPRVAKELGKAPLPVEAYNRDGTAKLAAGTLAVVDNQINTQTATIKLKATFPNPDRALWPNAFVKARLLLTTRKGALVVPAAVVQRGPQGTFAYVVNADDTVAVRPIEVDVIEGDTAILAHGVQPGERVVADGQSQLRPGSKVQVRPAEKAPAGTKAPAAAP